MSAVRTLQWRHNERDGFSNHQPRDCILKRLFRHQTSKLRVTGLCVGNSRVTGEFPHKWPVTRKMFPFDEVIMIYHHWLIGEIVALALNRQQIITKAKEDI